MYIILAYKGFIEYVKKPKLILINKQDGTTELAIRVGKFTSLKIASMVENCSEIVQ